MSDIKKEKFPKYQIRGEVVPDSIDKKNRTVDVVFGTEKRVRRRGWNGPYFEQLSFDPEHVQFERMASGRAPLLDNHNYYSNIERAQIGVVLSAEIKNKQGHATIKFSNRDAVSPIWQDVKDGITRNISVGYNIYSMEKTEHDDKPDEYRAIDWEAMELSLVPVPADMDAYTRAATADDAPFQEVNIIQNKKSSFMNPKDDANKGTPNGGNPADDKNKRSDGQLELKPVVETPVIETPVIETRSVETPAPIVDQNAVNESITLAERTRTAEIQKAVKTAGLSDEFSADLVVSGVSVDKARKAILEQWEKDGGAPTKNVNDVRLGDGDETDKRRGDMADAIMHRAGSLTDENGNVLDLPEGAKKYRSMNLFDMGKSILEMHGTRTAEMSRTEIVQNSLVSNTRAMSTSDFPIILGNTINRVLRKAYSLQTRTFQPFTRRVAVTDFKTRTSAQLSGMVKSLDLVQEGGEYKMNNMDEAKEIWNIAKYGSIVPVTWEMLVNDDLDAFSRIPSALAAKAAQKQSDIVWAIITANAAMQDGTALFHADHDNLAGSGAAISVATLGAARAAMRNQTGIEGDFINVEGKYLIVGPDSETVAQQIVTMLTVPNTDGTTNPFKGAYTLIVEPRLTGNQWYLSAMPTMIDTIEYGFLDGQEIQTTQREGFEIDGMEVKLLMTFGAKAIDWRGLYKNAGA